MHTDENGDGLWVGVGCGLWVEPLGEPHHPSPITLHPHLSVCICVHLWLNALAVNGSLFWNCVHRGSPDPAVTGFLHEGDQPGTGRRIGGANRNLLLKHLMPADAPNPLNVPNDGYVMQRAALILSAED